MKKEDFSPLFFLASLGAGGIAVTPFVLMQYTTEHGKGLITRSQLWENGFSGFMAGYFYSLELVMIIFSVLHFVLTLWFGIQLFRWIKEGNLKTLIEDPLKNASILTPFISLLMTMNLFIGPVRYFFPIMSDNFQDLFLPAMIFWLILFISIIYIEIKLLAISFIKGFDIEKIHFGWLLHPFLLGMLSTVGTGIAAMSKDLSIADTAAFLSLVPLSMGLFLFIIKLIILFKSHFAKQGLPEKQFLPSFLIIIPNITLFAISFFRLGHYLETHRGFHLDSYFYIVLGIAFAFEIWYLLFGLFLLKDYFKNNHFNDFYITQWGFICPFVAFVVLGSFTYNTVIQSKILYGTLLMAMLFAIFLYFELLIKHIKCAKNKAAKPNC
jgi:hypothetical protein